MMRRWWTVSGLALGLWLSPQQNVIAQDSDEGSEAEAAPEPAGTDPDDPWLPGSQAGIDTFNEGVLALEEARPSDAAGHFAAALELHPGSGLTLTQLAIALVRSGRASEARRHIDRAVELFPERVDVHITRSNAAFAQQDFATAQAAAWRATELAPGSVGAWQVVVQAELRAGGYQRARQGLAGSALDSGDRACLEILLWLDEGERARADDLAATCSAGADRVLVATTSARLRGAGAAASYGIDSVALLERGAAAREAGDLARAEELLSRSLALDGQRADARLERALGRYQAGQLAAALEDLHQVIDADSWITSHASGLFTGILSHGSAQQLEELKERAAALLGLILAEQGQAEQAAAVLAKALESYGDSALLAEGRVMLAVARERIGDAWTELGLALDTWPDEDRLLGRLNELAHDHPETLPEALAAKLAASGGSWGPQFNAALAAYQAGEHRACLEGARPGSSEAPVELRPRFGELMYLCALNEEEWELAEEFVGAGIERQPGQVLYHASRLGELGRFEESIRLLQRFPADGAQQETRMQLLMQFHLELGQLDEALVLVPSGTPELAYWLGQELIEAERGAEARPVLEPVCGELEQEHADWCRELVAGL